MAGSAPSELQGPSAPAADKEVVVIDIAEAVSRFERSTRAFLAELESGPEGAWNVRLDGEGWSLAETVEHVVLTNHSVCAMLSNLLASPFPADEKRLDDAEISAVMFETAGPPPPGLAEPKGLFATRTDGIAALSEVRDRLITWTGSLKVDLRAYGLMHPVFGLLDGVQWVLFVAAHTDNHLPQIEEFHGTGVRGAAT